jgi:hypothetical protein
MGMLGMEAIIWEAMSYLKHQHLKLSGMFHWNYGRLGCESMEAHGL